MEESSPDREVALLRAALTREAASAVEEIERLRKSPDAFRLRARLRALGRRRTDASHGGTVLKVGPIALDDSARLLTVDGRRVDLSPREFAMLECLLRHPGQALSRDQLLDHAWPYGVEVTYSSVDAYVYFLRRKLGPGAGALIETVRGIGYRLAAA